VRGKKKEFQRQARKKTQRVWWLCITLRAPALKLFFRHRLNRVSDSKAIHLVWIPLECLRHSGNDKGEKPSALRRCTYKTLCALGERSLRVLGVNESFPSLRATTGSAAIQFADCFLIRHRLNRPAIQGMMPHYLDVQKT
jgi:hypothetical protein